MWRSHNFFLKPLCIALCASVLTGCAMLGNSDEKPAPKTPTAVAPSVPASSAPTAKRVTPPIPTATVRPIEKVAEQKAPVKTPENAPAKTEKSWWNVLGGDEKATATPAKSAAAASNAVSVDPAWLDKTEKDLKTAVQGSQFTVERRGAVLAVIAPADKSFNKDRPQMLLPIALKPITQVAKQMAGDPNTVVLVAGHSDNQGAVDANRKLTEERALSVGAIFRLSGLKNERLVLMGFGADKPRASNADQTGRAANRRVEMLVTQRAAAALLAQSQSKAQ